MSRNVVTVDEAASLLESPELTRERKIKRVPVLCVKSVVGIVRRGDQRVLLTKINPGGTRVDDLLELDQGTSRLRRV